ncbi:diguanylate cyclase [Pseudomonas graminis]|uniref:GGDEF domain-containing protein n=1 Tax=Pseudomonas graminis TaxID=158627 RepID=UPI00234B3C0F|nr:diguanylate cyclase [Pseudomonas graminis]MDC6378918.1 diguanylate cyclase [Pseudomonas graminis]
MLSIDTLYFTSTISRATILFIFGVLLISQPRAGHLWHWCVALLCSGIGTLMNGPYSEVVKVSQFLPLLTMMLFAISLLASWTGLRIFYGRHVHLSWWLISILPSAVYMFGIQVGAPAELMLTSLYLFAALMAVMPLYEILTSSDRRIFSQYVVGLAFGIYTIVLMLSAALILIGKLAADSQRSAVISLAFDQVASILVYFGYIAMAGERAALDLHRQAETDILTGLTNRRGGNRLLERLHAEALERRGYSVVIGDIDHFKRVNDTFGHEAGDIVLKLLAERLTRLMRKNDGIIRWGGEEFLVVLPHTQIKEAEMLAERLRQQVAAEPFKIGDRNLDMTLSLGISACRVDDSKFGETIVRADQALYRAKKEGRNRVAVSQ